MKKTKYVVLLRGINAGGNKIIKMSELKILFEKIGFENVMTYIQSGNIIFDTENNKTELARKIEKALSEKFDNTAGIVILTFAELKKIITKKPEGFGEKNDTYKYNVFFLIEPLKAKEAITKIKRREGVDNTYEGTRVVYFSYLISMRTKSYISKINELEIYPRLTIRNWNTTEKLYELIKGK
jgi:uncharacterized protein (DUF1697 family)